MRGGRGGGGVPKNGTTTITEGLKSQPIFIKKTTQKKKTNKQRVGGWKFTFFLVLALSCVANKSITCNLGGGGRGQ